MVRQWVGLGAGARRDVDLWVPCCAGARRRRGAACTHLLPDTSSPFPVTCCSSGRELGRVAAARRARLAVGGRVLGAHRDVHRWLPAARARARGEEQLVPTSSRILLHLSRLMVAVPAANLARCGCRAGQRLAVGRVWGAGGRCDVDRRLPAARARASGEERLVPTSSRILFHLSRLKIAVPAANLLSCG